jgi:hypothetical protein
VTDRPEGWELRNAQKMWRPRANEEKDLDADMMFEWRWGRPRHCDNDMGDPHGHCPRCGGVLQADHPGGQPCPAPTEK